MAKEGSLSLDRQGRIIRFSHSLEEILGFEAAEVLGRDISFLVEDAAASELLSGLEKTDGEAALSAGKISVLCADGTRAELYITLYPLRDRTGALYSSMLSLSSRKTGVPAILTDEFRRMFTFSNDAVAITDRDGSIIDVNQAFLDTYGYQRHEALGRNPRILKSVHSTRDLYERMWSDILDPEKGYWRGEIINLAKDGTEVPVLLSINAIKDSRGEIKNFLGIAFNMTRQKELDKLKKMYMDYIVHDIRGPLTSISVNSEILLMFPELNDKTRRKVEIILASAQKINSMTTDLLDFSRAQSGNLAMKKETLKICEVIREAAQPFEGSGKALIVNGRPFSECAGMELEVLADSDKLQRVVYNLLSNAFKHAASEVSLTAAITSEGLEVTVSDNGKGISGGEAARIFDAFYQTEDGIKTGGAGLGLSIVKSFVEAHGGTVWVEPGKDRGVTFGFVIPCCQAV